MTAPTHTPAPYALVRLVGIAYPERPDGSMPFRRTMDRLTELHAHLRSVGPELAQALYDSASGHPADFHRAVVLPLRRDVFNGRVPRSSRLAQLGDLPERVPGLLGWLDAMHELSALRDALAKHGISALAAERSTLAQLCGAERLHKAVTLTGADLLRGVVRAAKLGAEPDSRSRKSEPAVLRYALRISTKTSPLSWFTPVAWGRWDAAPVSTSLSDNPIATTQPQRTLLARLTAALDRRVGPRAALRYRAAPGLRQTEGQIAYRRDIPLDTVDRLTAVREEQVVISATPPLALLLREVAAAGPAGARAEDLATSIAARIPGPADRKTAAAARFVEQAIAGRVIVAAEPVNPQHPQYLSELSGWLARHGDPDLAALLDEISEQTVLFAGVRAADRAAALARLTALWREALAMVDVPWLDMPVLAEDVVLPGTVHIEQSSAVDSLARFAALAEVFDFQVVMRRIVRDAFVARFGVGGDCTDVVGFSSAVTAAWPAAFAATAGDAALEQLSGLRAKLTTMIRAAGDGTESEVIVPEEAVALAAEELPGWAAARPASYAFFVQPVPGEGGLVLNHTYGGWGKYTSRFLGQLPDRAGQEVAAQITRTVGPTAKVLLFRPVAGFNANLHPAYLPTDVGEEAAWSAHSVEHIGMRHDPETDQIRMYVKETGQSVDIIYPGFLIPLALPDRLGPFYSDLGGGPVTFSHLVGDRQVAPGVRFRPRLRYENLVISRRSWTLSADRASALRKELDAGPDVPTETVAALRAEIGLPGEVFVKSAGRGEMTNAQDLRDYLAQAKPQYVDLGNALHLRCLARLLARHPGAVRLEEALPSPSPAVPAGQITELVVETYRKESPTWTVN